MGFTDLSGVEGVGESQRETVILGQRVFGTKGTFTFACQLAGPKVFCGEGDSRL